MGRRFIIFAGLGLLGLFVLYRTGVFADVVMFFAAGVLPWGQVDSTVLLGILAILLVIIGYVLGFSHGMLHKMVQQHLAAIKHGQPAGTVRAKPATPLLSERKRRRIKTAQAKAVAAKVIASGGARKQRGQVVAMAAAAKVRQVAVQQYSTVRPKVSAWKFDTIQRALLFVAQSVFMMRMAISWLVPLVRKVAKRLVWLAGRSMRLGFELLERCWIWLRYP